jgi:hypothetical protein
MLWNIMRNRLFPNLMVCRNMLAVERLSMHLLGCMLGDARGGILHEV